MKKTYSKKNLAVGIISLLVCITVNLETAAAEKNVNPKIIPPLEDASIAYDSNNNLWAFVGVIDGEIWLRVYNRSILMQSYMDIAYGMRTPLIETRLSRMRRDITFEDENFRCVSENAYPEFVFPEDFNITDRSVDYSHSKPAIIYAGRTFFVVWKQNSLEFGQQAVCMVFELRYVSGELRILKWNEPRVLNTVTFYRYSNGETGVHRCDIERIDLDKTPNGRFAIVTMTIANPGYRCENGELMTRAGEIRIVPLDREIEYDNYHYNLSSLYLISFTMTDSRVHLSSVSGSMFNLPFSPSRYRIAILESLSTRVSTPLRGMVFDLDVGADSIRERIDYATEIEVVPFEYPDGPASHTMVVRPHDAAIRLVSSDFGNNCSPIIVYTYTTYNNYWRRMATRIKVVTASIFGYGFLSFSLIDQLADIQPPQFLGGEGSRYAPTDDFAPRIIANGNECMLTFQGFRRILSGTREEFQKKIYKRSLYLNRSSGIYGIRSDTDMGSCQPLTLWRSDIEINKNMAYDNNSGSFLSYWNTRGVNSYIPVKSEWLLIDF